MEGFGNLSSPGEHNQDPDFPTQDPTSYESENSKEENSLKIIIKDAVKNLEKFLCGLGLPSFPELYIIDNKKSSKILPEQEFLATFYVNKRVIFVNWENIIKTVEESAGKIDLVEQIIVCLLEEYLHYVTLSAVSSLNTDDNSSEVKVKSIEVSNNEAGQESASSMVEFFALKERDPNLIKKSRNSHHVVHPSFVLCI